MRATRILIALLLAGAAVSCSSSPGSTAAPTTTPAALTGTGTATPPGSAGSGAVGSGTTPASESSRPRTSPGCAPGATAPTKGQPTDEATRSSGADRTFKRYVPSSYTGTTPVPLVIDLHGYIEGNGIHTVMTNVNGTAETNGFINLTPQGTGKLVFWNAGPTADGPDDVRYISDLIDLAGQQLCVDLSRVYVTGLSNGAFMSSLVACRLSDKVAAIAPVAGLMRPTECHESRPVPIVAFHGTADSLVQYASGDSGPNASANALPFDDESRKIFEAVNFQAIPVALEQWADSQGCVKPAREQRVSPSVMLISYEGCRGGSTVELYRVDGGGHTWPGSTAMGTVSDLMGVTTTEIDANDLMWQFFQRHHL